MQRNRPRVGLDRHEAVGPEHRPLRDEGHADASFGHLETIRQPARIRLGKRGTGNRNRLAQQVEANGSRLGEGGAELLLESYEAVPDDHRWCGEVARFLAGNPGNVGFQHRCQQAASGIAEYSGRFLEQREQRSFRLSQHRPDQLFRIRRCWSTFSSGDARAVNPAQLFEQFGAERFDGGSIQSWVGCREVVDIAPHQHGRIIPIQVEDGTVGCGYGYWWRARGCTHAQVVTKAVVGDSELDVGHLRPAVSLTTI